VALWWSLEWREREPIVGSDGVVPIVRAG